VYDRPGGKPEIRWSTVMEDLRRRDFSINAIAISLNPNSRGLLLDPTNGLADLEKHEVRALSIHAFTNQPIRLLRILRFCSRMGFKMESRTAEWFELALERGLQETIPGADLGDEVRQLGREDNPVAVLKAWESRGLLGLIHPHLERRRPDYDSLSRLARVRESMLAAGVRPRLGKPITYYLLGRLKPRERSAALHRMEWRTAEIEAVLGLPAEAEKVLKMLRGRKTNSPRDAYFYIAQVPLDVLAFLQVEFPNPRALSKIRNYLTKWRPLRLSLPVAELDSLGIPRGPKFDKILEDLFALQLRGKGRNPIDRTKLLRQLAGIKEEPKKKAKEEKKKTKEKAHPAAAKTKAPAASGHPTAPAEEKKAGGTAAARKLALEPEPAAKESKKAAAAPKAPAKRGSHPPVHAGKKHKAAKHSHAPTVNGCPCLSRDASGLKSL
jgi:tRNA nucleotidyltransferase/poly(A) polymerase